jgi:hypothetical protein
MARKSKGLPFVVQPRLQPIVERIGTEDSGVIEIERRGYLSVAEKAIAQQATQGDESVRKMYALGGRIARETGKQQLKVMQDLMQQDRPEYLSSFEDEILENMIEMMAYQERVDIVQATALIICRVDEKWTVEQSMDLHPDLIKLLSTLYNEEDSREVEALESAAKQNSGAEGK